MWAEYDADDGGYRSFADVQSFFEHRRGEHEQASEASENDVNQMWFVHGQLRPRHYDLVFFVGGTRRKEGIDQVGMMGSFLRYEGRVSTPLQYRLLRCSGYIEGLVARSRRSKRPRRGSLEGSTAPPGVKDAAPGGLAGRNGLSGRSG